MGFSADWIRKLVRRYNDDPEKGLKDKRRNNGNAPVLAEELQQELGKALGSKPPDLGLWSGPKVAQWFKVGSKPRARHRIQYKWIHVYGFVHPASGRTHWLLLPSVSCKIMQIALESFAREYVDADTLIVLLWDRAGFHQTSNMQVPEGTEFFPLPPYTPELQPAERLRALIQTPEQTQALTGFGWILSAQNATS